MLKLGDMSDGLKEAFKLLLERNFELGVNIRMNWLLFYNFYHNGLFLV